METIQITIKLLEPYRVMEWFDPAERGHKDRYLRENTFARWHKNKEDGKRRPYIPMELLLSKAKDAAEKLLRLTDGRWENKEVCDYAFRPYGKELRSQRSTTNHKWSSQADKLCTSNDPCPFCILFRKSLFLKEKQDKHSIRPIEIDGFINLSRFTKLNGIEYIAAERVLNRVDSFTGKSRDYFRVWEIDRENMCEYSAKIHLNYYGPPEKEADHLRAASSLLRASLSFLDKLCGASCVIKIETPRSTEPVSVSMPPDMTEQAKSIFQAFAARGKEDAVRRLADAILSLRSELPSKLDNLPPGKGKRDHHTWDVLVEGRKLRDYLKAVLRDGETWRADCKSLGLALKKVSKTETGARERLERMFGDVEYYGARSMAGTEGIPALPDEKMCEWIVTGELKAEAPFFFGVASKDDEHTDLAILLDSEGRYRIPRSALRGNLRKELRAVIGQGCKDDIGRDFSCSCRVCTIMHDVTIMDTRSSEVVPPQIRQRIRIDPRRGTVEEGALFDMEVGLEGFSFPFLLRYRGSSFPKELKAVLKTWKESTAWIGGARATGKGLFCLAIGHAYKWPLDLDKGLPCYLENHGFRDTATKRFPEILPECIENLTIDDLLYEGYASPWKEITYTITISSPLILADPIAALTHPGNHDLVFFKKRVWDGTRSVDVPAVKSESIRGLVRTAVGKAAALGKITDPLTKDHEDCDCILCSIFGSGHSASAIRFSDLTPISSCKCNEKAIDHVAINRFLGGAEENMKFDLLALTGDPLTMEGKFWIRSEVLKTYKTDLKKALTDISRGFFPVGGKTGSGYGRIESLDITDPQGILSLGPAENKGGEIAPSPEYIYPPRDALPDDDQSIYYHPHYFITPHTSAMDRTPVLVGHHQFYNEFDGKKLITGKISCKLRTLTPLIIPDSEGVIEDASTKHKKYKFFTINNKPMIPGSEIRGMISSVYETITNSCFRVFDEEYVLSRRMLPDKNIKRGRVVPGPTGTDLQIEEVPMYRLPLYHTEDLAETIPELAKDDQEWSNTETGKLGNALSWNKEIAKRACINREFLEKNFNDQERDAILSGQKPITFRTERIGNNRYDEVAILSRNGKKELTGYIKFTGLNRVEKEMYNNATERQVKTCRPLPSTWMGKGKASQVTLHNSYDWYVPPNSERTFPRSILRFLNDEDKCLYTIPKGCERVFVYGSGKEYPSYAVSDKAKNEYRDTLKSYSENLNRVADPFRTYLHVPNKELTIGDLVYFQADEIAKKVLHVFPVPISRIADSAPMEKRLPPHLRPCEGEPPKELMKLVPSRLREAWRRMISVHEEGLCPACRLFGTTNYKGRVSFGFAEHTGDIKWLMGGEDEYLIMPLQERPRATWSMPVDGADVPGRKFYIHHHGWEEIFNTFQNKKNEMANNASLQPLHKNNAFKFEIFFENLHEWELGLLLYSLELEPGRLAHKLGRGKANGFGSVIISVTSIEERIDSSHFGDITGQKGNLLRKGFSYLADKLFHQVWDNVPHIIDLIRVLQFPEEGKRHNVAYPPLRNRHRNPPGYVEMKGDLSSAIQNRSRKERKWIAEKIQEYLRRPWVPWFPRTQTAQEIALEYESQRK